MDEETELIEEEELYELHYSDLMLVSEQLSQSRQIGEIMKALGPTGPGLLSITGVPNPTTSLRRHLLPLARNLALLSPDHRLRILKEHNLGSDVPLKDPDRSVSSFAMQLRYEQGLESVQSKPSHSVDTLLSSEQEHLDVGTMGEIQDSEFKNLGNTFRKLGFCMMDLGLRIARICDKAIGGQELEQSLMESCAAKGRLIHYHSALDNLVLREAGESKATTKRQANGRRDDKNSTRNRQGQSKGAVNLDSNGSEVGSSGIHSNLWQQWHYDYECPSPSGHTYLQIFNPYKNNVCVVKASPESFIIQPAWNKTFSISDYPMEQFMSCHEETNHSDNKLTQEIGKIIPPLSSRLKDGMTFAEFSRETTKQYYGGSGLQSNR
ncbi:hypothetical protein ACB098_10G073500 [Castanea mollissima]|uniref:Uncharacterized protein n=1 Tax=Castanea mollissima TaxID=60419 RepID=A0A8J4QRI2_9ROSI|nr:hypothetical protein CMV_018474 [Castanea mollissima]